MNLRSIIKLIKENNVYTEHDAYYANYLKKQYPEIYEFFKKITNYSDEDIFNGSLGLTSVFNKISEDDLLKANVAINYINRKFNGDFYLAISKPDGIPNIEFLNKIFSELS